MTALLKSGIIVNNLHGEDIKEITISVGDDTIIIAKRDGTVYLASTISVQED